MEEKNLGVKLSEAWSDKGKIALRAGIRFSLGAIVVVAGMRSNPIGRPVSFMAGAVAFLIFALAAAYVFWPLTHLRDYVEFYEYGICYCGKKWTFEELGEVSFCEMKSSRSFFADVYMRSNKKSFLFTYIKDGKKQYNRAYMNIYQ